MQTNDVNPKGMGTSDPESGSGAVGVNEALLARVRAVAQRITERVREVTGDTQETAALPSEPTKSHPPLRPGE